jgi:carbon-monoxide dehydrogenase medium subunit
MFPAAFEYHKPTTLCEALALLDEFGENAKLMSGGHSLIPAMKLRLIQPEHLIDLGAVDILKGIRTDSETIIVGAATTHWEVESSTDLKETLPVLCEVARVIADPQVRNRGTMGGSLVNSDPAADWPATVVALDAELVCRSKHGERVVQASEWFQDLFVTALMEGEILCAIRFKRLPPRTAAAYQKLPHPASRFALVGVSAAVTTDEGGNCIKARVGITGVHKHAVHAHNIEQALKGRPFIPEVISSVATVADCDLDIGDDIHFSEQDRRELCRTYVERTLRQTHQRMLDCDFQSK